jgi:carbon storage regulator
MLVLTRALNETIMIGDDIEVTIVDVKGDKVRVGIQAPHAVPVHRKEVYLAIKQANIEASQATPESLGRLPDLNKLIKRKETGGPRGTPG